MTHFDRHAFIFDENVQIRTLHDYVSKKKGQQVRLVPKPIREIKLVPGVNQRKIPKFKKPLEQRHIVLKIDPSRLTGEGEEKKEVKEEEKKEAMKVEKNETMEIEKSEVKKEVNNEEKETEKSEVMEIEKKESTDTEKPQAQESTPIKEDISTQTPETKKEETATPTNTQSTPTNSTDNDLLTDHRDMYFAD